MGATALGAWLVSRSLLVKGALVLAGIGGIGSVAAVVVVRSTLSRHFPSLTAATMAWSAGISLALGGGLRAIDGDRKDGVLALFRMRGVGTRSYLRARVTGLVLVLALAVGGPTLLAGLAAMALTADRAGAARETLGGIAYACAFSGTVGPLAMATLGSGPRMGGYLFFLGSLVLPELIAPAIESVLPAGWHELTSIPAALGAVGTGVSSPITGGAALARALCGLVGVGLLSFAVLLARFVPDEGWEGR
jgi:hypothetical protein